jgi:cytoskeleton protein RodZ
MVFMNTDTGSNNFETNPGSQVSLLGDHLKQKRLEKNYTLEKLSQKTKISVNILRCLEANDFKGLPSAAYIKGFVISYSKVLGLDLDESINKLEYTYLKVLNKPFPALNHTKSMKGQAEPAPSKPRPQARPKVTPAVEKVEPVTSSGTPAAEEPSPHKVIESGEPMLKNTKPLVSLAILVGIILLVFGGYKLVSSVVDNEVKGKKVRDLGPRIESSAALVKPEQRREEPAQPLTPPAETAAEPVVEAKEPVAAAQQLPVEKKPEPQFQRNFPHIDFKRFRGPLFEIRTDDTSDTEHLTKTARDAMNPSVQNIYIKAVDGNTWLSYKIDNNPIESIIITKNNDLFLQGNEIRIFLGNVNVTRIFYNNYLIATPTKTGVKSLVFPESSNEKFVMPLFPKANDDVLYTSEDYIKRMKIEEEELARRQTGTR